MKNLARRSSLTLGLAFVLAACGSDNTGNKDAGDGGGADTAGTGGSDAPAGGSGGGGRGGAPADGARDGAGADGGVPMGDGPIGGSEAGPGVEAGSGAGNVGPGGGRVTSADGRVTLDVPPGALDKTVAITIERLAMPVMGALGAVYEIRPPATRFMRPAQVTFRPVAADLMGAPIGTVLVALQTSGSSWIELEDPVNDARAGAVRGNTTELGRYGLLAGLCRACPTACDAATCRFGGMPGVPGSGVAGVCEAFGRGCSRCVPVCDGDKDGYCPGSPPSDQPGGDCADGNPRVNPGAREICGNDIDDNCNSHVDEGCKPCTGDNDCPTGSEACIEGVCAVCDGSCDMTNCRFGAREGVPGSGIVGKCVPFGRGCNRCVPLCDNDNDGACPGMPPSDQMGGDCNDNDPNAGPNKPELCTNNVDDDCDGKVDEGCTACTSDTACGMGQRCAVGFCEACPTPACDPATCRFGATAVPMSGVAGKCVAQGNMCNVCVPTCDGDGDGFCPGSPPSDQPGGDCNDGNRAVNPSAPELCGNMIDDNCNSHVDEGCTACARDSDCSGGLIACIDGKCAVCDSGCEPASCRFGMREGMPTSGVAGRCVSFASGCMRCVPACDTDGDGFCPGMPANDQPGGDCDDANPAAHPNAREICGNMLDDDCSGIADDKCTTCQTSMDMCGPMETCSSGR